MTQMLAYRGWSTIHKHDMEMTANTEHAKRLNIKNGNDF